VRYRHRRNNIPHQTLDHILLGNANINKLDNISVFVRQFKKPAYYHHYLTNVGTAVAQWLKYCATNRKVASSIPNCHWNFSLT
jgi:hypothetical protein